MAIRIATDDEASLSAWASPLYNAGRPIGSLKGIAERFSSAHDSLYDNVELQELHPPVGKIWYCVDCTPNPYKRTFQQKVDDLEKLMKDPTASAACLEASRKRLQACFEPALHATCVENMRLRLMAYTTGNNALSDAGIHVIKTACKVMKLNTEKLEKNDTIHLMLAYDKLEDIEAADRRGELHFPKRNETIQDKVVDGCFSMISGVVVWLLLVIVAHMIIGMEDINGWLLIASFPAAAIVGLLINIAKRIFS